MINISNCTRFQLAPEELHLNAMNRILRYLSRTILGLWYVRGGNVELLGYSDAKCICFAIHMVHKESTSRSCQFLEQSFVPWYNEK